MRYPSVQCLNPRRIMNPYTREMMTVPCGHCKACALTKCNHLALWCNMESKCHKYCLFVTLTYANRFIPRLKVVDNLDRLCGRDCVDENGEILTTLDMSPDKYDAFMKKLYLFGDVPYLRKTDLQKFLKRFRYYVSKTTKAKVRYFACGEYGPTTFRPHYHLLLWFDDPRILQMAEQAILQSWPFGRCDVQLSQGKSAYYVASYVNSYGTLPEVFKSRSVCPFYLHSQKLGFGLLQSERQKVYETSVRDFVKRGFEINGAYREFNLPVSFYSAFFPKCRGFADCNAQQLSYSYRVYDEARKNYPEFTTTIDLAKEIALTYRYFGADGSSFTGNESWRRLIQYFADPSIVNCDVESEQFDHYILRIYNELLLSKHFLYFVCDHVTTYEINRKIKMIKAFYSVLDAMRLADFFQYQSDFYVSNLYGEEDLMKDNFDNSFFPYFYNNLKSFDYENYKVTPCYQFLKEDACKRFEARIKHKKLNDLNKIFVED